MDDATAAQVGVEDRLAICDTVYRYALGLDLRDWEGYLSLFTDEIDVDFSSYDGRTNYRVSTDEWLAQVKPLFTGLAATQHSMTNPRVFRLDDATVCQMYMQAEHVLDPEDPTSRFTLAGYYTDRVVHTRGSWLLSGVTLTALWQRGRPDIMATARERGARLLEEQG